ncbi:hypothetical protein [Aureimonas leprariae]|uniref:pyroglutamyl-peptidase I family protein n=1 Tax=Plantimonas leprariae TaxID=2615207 RepID=UPI0013871546|nr:hypothetical protein [Aureimonas leprariae]
MKLLLAGFSAFPGAPENPSERLVREFDAVAFAEGACIERLVLPVEWKRSWRVLEAAIRRTAPVAVLLVGLHARAKRFRIETLAFNERALDRPDAAGRLAPAPDIGAGPASIEVRLPFDALERDLAAVGIDFERSSDPGRYLCNETLFHLCLNGDELGVRYYGFIHTPLTDECVTDAERSGRPKEVRRTVRSSELRSMTETVLNCLAWALAQEAERSPMPTA